MNGYESSIRYIAGKDSLALCGLPVHSIEMNNHFAIQKIFFNFMRSHLSIVDLNH